MTAPGRWFELRAWVGSRGVGALCVPHGLVPCRYAEPPGDPELFCVAHDSSCWSSDRAGKMDSADASSACAVRSPYARHPSVAARQGRLRASRLDQSYRHLPSTTSRPIRSDGHRNLAVTRSRWHPGGTCPFPRLGVQGGTGLQLPRAARFVRLVPMVVGAEEPYGGLARVSGCRQPAGFLYWKQQGRVSPNVDYADLGSPRG